MDLKAAANRAHLLEARARQQGKRKPRNLDECAQFERERAAIAELATLNFQQAPYRPPARRW